MLSNKGVFYWSSCAKKTAAFFNISRSIRNCSTSLRKRVNSDCSVKFKTGFLVADTVGPFSLTNLAASFLNSSVYWDVYVYFVRSLFTSVDIVNLSLEVSGFIKPFHLTSQRRAWTQLMLLLGFLYDSTQLNKWDLQHYRAWSWACDKFRLIFQMLLLIRTVLQCLPLFRQSLNG